LDVTGVIAFGYYDGVTEGVARQAFGADYCYFKVIAWDGGQDDRLHAVVEISATAYLRIASLLESAQAAPDLHAWVPAWDLLAESHRTELEAILKRLQDDLLLKGALVYSIGMGQREALRVAIDASNATRVGAALLEDAPGDVAQWKREL